MAKRSDEERERLITEGERLQEVGHRILADPATNEEDRVQVRRARQRTEANLRVLYADRNSG